MPRFDQQITFEGRTQTIAEWAEEIGISPDGLYRRIYKLLWDVDKALTTPNANKRTYYGKTLSEWTKETGIHRQILWHRFHSKRGSNLSSVLETPKPKVRSIPYPPLIFGYHRERLQNKKKRCCHPDCFNCPYKDCVMK